jgi:two-component system, sensor histidine kinase LadS
MRLRFNPVFLCLLLVISLSPTSAEANFKAASFKAKNTASKDISNNQSLILAPSSNSLVETQPMLVSGTAESLNTLLLKKNELTNYDPAKENSYFYSEVYGKNSENISAKISTQELALATHTKKTFLQGLYYGFALLLLLANLVCYFIFEEKLFLFYTLALLGSTALFFYNDGLYYVFGIFESNNHFLGESILLWLAMGSTAYFASKYLNIKKFYPKLKVLATPLIVIGGILAITAFLAKDISIAYTANFVSISLFVCYFGASVLLFNQKNYAKFFAIATFIPLLFTFDYFILKNIGVHFLSTETVHIKIAGLIEMLLLSYAILYRMRALKEESENRQTEMRIFLERQELMNRQSAMKLMEDVYLENLIMHYDLDGLEIKLLQYISEGKENDKIAQKLKTTVADVEELTKELYQKLEIGEQVQEDYNLLESQPDYIYN